MFLLLVFLISLFIVAGVCVLSAVSDIRGMTIPNQYSLIVIGAFGACYAVLSVFGRDDVFYALHSHILAMVVMFFITLAMFAFKLIGAGDSKLASALALWAGLKGLIPFIFYMSVAGGLLGLTALALKKWKPIKEPKENSWVARVQAGESKVPYGVAIALGALASFVEIGYLERETLASFLL